MFDSARDNSDSVLSVDTEVSPVSVITEMKFSNNDAAAAAAASEAAEAAAKAAAAAAEGRIRALERENAMLRASSYSSQMKLRRQHQSSRVGIDLSRHISSRIPGAGMLSTHTEMVVGAAVSPDREQQRRQSLATDGLSSFCKTVSVAMKWSRRSSFAGDGEQEILLPSFQHFLLLSLNRDFRSNDIKDDCVVQAGPRYLDAFQFLSADEVDSFPPQSCTEEAQVVPLYDVACFSAFCLPKGVSARIVPKVAMERAKQMGWTGEKGDKYHALVFTDGAGVASYGVAITVRDVVDYAPLISFLSRQRKKRRAAFVLCRWWRRKRSTCVRFFLGNQSSEPSHDRARTGEGAAAPQRGQKSRMMTTRSGSQRRFGFFGRLRRKSGAGGVEEDDNDRRNSDDEDGRSVASTKTTNASSLRCAIAAGQSESSRSVVASSSRRLQPSNSFIGIYHVLEEFLEGSPIPIYNSRTETGFWKSAKLRVKKKTKEHLVIMKHTAVQNHGGGEGTSFDYTDLFEKEKYRLMNMLAAVDIHPTMNDNRGLHASQHHHSCYWVSCVCFQEVNRGSTNELVNETYVRISDLDDELQQAHVSKRSLTFNIEEELTAKEEEEQERKREKARLRAMEAYEEILDAESHGEVCLVEKCYVLMGGKAQDLSLLFASLQALVDSERNMSDAVDNDIPEEFSPNISQRNLQQQRSIRYKRLNYIQLHARLSPEQKTVKIPKSEMEQVYGERKYFELNPPFRNMSPIKMPLPLPQVAADWGLARIFLRVNPSSLMTVLKQLLLEHSVLILGECAEEVTFCTSAFQHLLLPYEWPNVFLPILPQSMLDLLHSPVPFLAGLAVEGNGALKMIETDYRIQEALDLGMSVVNITTGVVTMRIEAKESLVLSIPPSLRRTLDSLQSRLEELTDKTDAASASIQVFVQKGFSPKKSATLHSIRKHIYEYMKKLAGDLAIEKDAWEEYAEQSNNNNSGGGGSSSSSDIYDFSPDIYCNVLCAEIEFRKAMAYTQMFSGYVHRRRKEYAHIIELQNGKAGNFLASWIHSKWNERKGEERRKGQQKHSWPLQLQ